MVFIIIWNVAGELVKPKNMTVGSNRPSGVRKAAFSFIALLDVNVIVALSYVKLGKEGVAAEPINGGWDEWGHIAVLLCPLVNGAKILDWVQFAIFLLDEEEACYIRAP
jgi:hypothetical protein